MLLGYPFSNVSNESNFQHSVTKYWGLNVLLCIHYFNKPGSKKENLPNIVFIVFHLPGFEHTGLQPIMACSDPAVDWVYPVCSNPGR